MLFVLGEGCRWRALGSFVVAWQTVYGHYRRWLAAGIIHELLNAIHTPGAELEAYGFMDATHVKVHRDGANPEGGQAAQGIGRTRGGSNTKVHTVVGANSKPLRIFIGEGQEHDSRQAEALTDGLSLSLVVADKAYDSDELRHHLDQCQTLACIPARSNRKQPLPFSKELYRLRHEVENFFEKIKRNRRVATRYDKLSITFLGFVQLAALCAILSENY